MKIFFGDDINDILAIISTHKGKQWSGHEKIYLKNIQEDGITLFQGIKPIIIWLTYNKLHRKNVCKCYDIIASSEMLSIEITSDSIKDETWYTVYEEVINEGFKRGHNYEITRVKKGKITILHELLPLIQNKL